MRPRAVLAALFLAGIAALSLFACTAGEEHPVSGPAGSHWTDSIIIDAHLLTLFKLRNIPRSDNQTSYHVELSDSMESVYLATDFSALKVDSTWERNEFGYRDSLLWRTDVFITVDRQPVAWDAFRMTTANMDCDTTSEPGWLFRHFSTTSGMDTNTYFCRKRHQREPVMAELLVFFHPGKGFRIYPDYSSEIGTYRIYYR